MATKKKTETNTTKADSREILDEGNVAKQTDENQAPQPGETSYQVAIDTSNRHVEIILEGHKPSEGHRLIGDFKADVVGGTINGTRVSEIEDFNTHGEHLLIAQTRAVLADLELTDLTGYVFEDKASNTPSGDSYVMDHTDRDRAVRDNVNPTERQAQISENLDKAEAKYGDADRKHKDDARPHGE